MTKSLDLQLTRMPLNNGTGHLPALGFGTLIPDAAVTKTATRDALDAGFRHFDCAEPVVQVESHPYLLETELLEFCKEKGIVFLAFAPVGHGMKPGLLEDLVISAIAARVEKTAGTGAAGMGGAARHSFAYHTQICGSRAREF